MLITATCYKACVYYYYLLLKVFQEGKYNFSDLGDLFGLIFICRTLVFQIEFRIPEIRNIFQLTTTQSSYNRHNFYTDRLQIE